MRLSMLVRLLDDAALQIPERSLRGRRQFDGGEQALSERREATLDPQGELAEVQVRPRRRDRDAQETNHHGGQDAPSRSCARHLPAADRRDERPGDQGGGQQDDRCPAPKPQSLQRANDRTQAFPQQVALIKHHQPSLQSDFRSFLLFESQAIQRVEQLSPIALHPARADVRNNWGQLFYTVVFADRRTAKVELGTRHLNQQDQLPATAGSDAARARRRRPSQPPSQVSSANSPNTPSRSHCHSRC